MAEKPSIELLNEITHLKKQLSQTPNDLDLKLKLASRLSWAGHWDESVDLAEFIVSESPNYLDAHILIARVNLWQEKYDRSIERIEKVLIQTPDNQEALLILAQSAKQSKRWALAHQTFDKLIGLEPKADHYVQKGQMELTLFNVMAARTMAKQALAIDPDNERAKSLERESLLLKLTGTSEFEFFPIDNPNLSRGLGFNLVASFIPRGKFSGVLWYIFNDRFNTSNHRFGGQLTWRPNTSWTLSGSMTLGDVQVVPKTTAWAEVFFKLNNEHTFGFRYTFDKLAWPGVLHRPMLSGSKRLSLRTAVTLKLTPGLLRHCGENNFAPNASLHFNMHFSKIMATAGYGIGTELERPPLASFLSGQLGDDVCFNPLDETQSPIELTATKAHTLSINATLRFMHKFWLRSGYAMQIRFNGDRVHIVHAQLSWAY